MKLKAPLRKVPRSDRAQARRRLEQGVEQAEAYLAKVTTEDYRKMFAGYQAMYEEIVSAAELATTTAKADLAVLETLSGSP